MLLIHKLQGWSVTVSDAQYKQARRDQGLYLNPHGYCTLWYPIRDFWTCEE